MECSAKEESEKKIRRKRGRGRFVLVCEVCFQKVIPSTFPRSHPYSRLVPSRFLIVSWDERRLGIRLRRARGVMGREEGKIAIFSSLSMRPRARLNLIPKFYLNSFELHSTRYSLSCLIPAVLALVT